MSDGLKLLIDARRAQYVATLNGGRIMQFKRAVLRVAVTLGHTTKAEDVGASTCSLTEGIVNSAAG
ncbi:MAG: hypothetical protein ABSG36_05755 [Acidimicrobiales bacterium]|jgi:hypothetical protein